MAERGRKQQWLVVLFASGPKCRLSCRPRYQVKSVLRENPPVAHVADESYGTLPSRRKERTGRSSRLPNALRGDGWDRSQSPGGIFLDPDSAQRNPGCRLVSWSNSPAPLRCALNCSHRKTKYTCATNKEIITTISASQLSLPSRKTLNGKGGCPGGKRGR